MNYNMLNHPNQSFHCKDKRSEERQVQDKVKIVAAEKIDNIVTNIQFHQVLHMNGGDGDNSYANNSLLQRKLVQLEMPMLQESVVELYTRSFPESIIIADMGCSSGPNAFLPTWEIIEAIDETCHRLEKNPPMLQVFLNDLPGNDFNSIFKSLPSFQKKLEEEKGGRFGSCFMAAMPGNFYGRLFPPHSLNFVHSSCSLHWFSEVPKIKFNKGQIYTTKTSPPRVHEVYLGQFEKDFTSFLRSRSEEVISGGKMVLTIYGKEENSYSSDTYNPSIWELFGMMLNDMVSEGIIEESKLDSFNIPFYGSSAEEVKNVIRKEGSFKLNKIESFQIGWDACIDDKYKVLMDKYTKGKFVANCLRAFLESFLATHFGKGIIDVIFQRFSIIIGDYLEIVDGVYTNVVSMTKG